MAAVIRSVLISLLLASICSARTVQNKPADPLIPTGIPNPGSKSPGRRIMHPAFENAGKVPGLEVWRIENFEPVNYPKNNYGKFFTGDSFIVLNTQKLKNGQLLWDAHFWLGSETSQDEAGAAAILTVQLDDLLNGGPVQHREVQDHESQLFLSYFKNGIRYEQGGVGTGFKHVETNAQGEKRLFQVKGKRNVRVRQVNLSVSSMNKGDCFILDAGNTIYVYVGSQSKRIEKLKAISAANQIRDQDHNGRARVEVIDDYTSEIDKENFFQVLGSGSPSEVPDESTAEEDAAFEKSDENSVTLYKVSDQSGKLKVDSVASKPLRQEMLDTKDCFILDTGSGIYVWVGRGATQQEKSQAMSKAQEFLTLKKYPAWTNVQRIVEGAESAPFKQYFATWRDSGMSHTRLIRSALGYDTDDSDVEFSDDIIENLKKSGGKAIGFMPDQGQETIVKIIQFTSQEEGGDVSHREVTSMVNNLLLGFASYVIQYNYKSKDQEGTVLYVWEGESAHKNTKKAAFKYAVVLADDINAIVVRSPQGHEPRHFVKMFKGKLISSYTGAPIKPQLFRVLGTDASDVRANEVPCDSSSLASDDVFVLVKTGDRKIYYWAGLGASAFEKSMAKERFADYWKDFESEHIEEGAEPDDFWEDLNGEGIYDRSIGAPRAPILEPRLFHFRMVGQHNNKIIFEEVPAFEQGDLDHEDVMMLDGGDEIYVWIGENTTPEEQYGVTRMVKEYIKKNAAQRTYDTVSVVRLLQSHEPKSFKRLFPEWDDDYWKTLSTYDDVKKQIEEANNELDDNEVA
ncbi:Gel family protein [Megaselia abdita]